MLKQRCNDYNNQTVVRGKPIFVYFAGHSKKSWTLKLHVSKINTSLCLLFRDLELVSILSNTQNGPIQMTNPSTISLLIYLYT